MAVYVDNMRAPFGRMIMCHMAADTPAELLAMAHAIGVDAKWIQDAGTHREHFDISLRMRQRAVDRGALEVTQLALGRMMNRKQKRYAEAAP